MSSHNLGEVSRLAQRVGIIHDGRLLQELSAVDLARQRRRRLLVGVRDPRGARALLLAAGFPAVLTTDGALKIRAKSAIAQPDTIASRLVHAGHPPTMLVTEQKDLEDYFMRLVGVDGGAGV